MTDSPPPSAEVPGDVTFGAALLILRRRAGLTGRELADRAGTSQARISRLEHGATVDPRDIPALGRELGLDEEGIQRLVELAEAEQGQDQTADWRPTPFGAAPRQHEFGQLESTAHDFRVFQPTVVVGLLQTSEYARSILSQFQSLTSARIADSPVDVSEAVSARIQRHGVLAEKNRQFRFVMSEAVLSNRFCRAADMLAQIDRIREVAEAENVTIGFVPPDAPWTIPPYHGFELLDEKQVLIDLVNTTLVSRERADIRLYREVFELAEKLSTTDVNPILDRYFDFYLEESRREHNRR
jgi:transcriptional regulator with XRE-family HTH domain